MGAYASIPDLFRTLAKAGWKGLLFLIAPLIVGALFYDISPSVSTADGGTRPPRSGTRQALGMLAVALLVFLLLPPLAELVQSMFPGALGGAVGQP